MFPAFKSPKDITPAKLTDAFWQIWTAIRQAGNLSSDGSVRIAKTAGGTCLSAPAKATQGRGGAAPLTGTALELDATQGTEDEDDYAAADDKVPVKFKVITDIQYDTTTHVLSYRTRTIECAYIKSISAESALVEITEAEACEPPA